MCRLKYGLNDFCTKKKWRTFLATIDSTAFLGGFT